MQQLLDAPSGRLLLSLGKRTDATPTCESHGLVQLSSTDSGASFGPMEDVSALMPGETRGLSPTGGIGGFSCAQAVRGLAVCCGL